MFPKLRGNMCFAYFWPPQKHPIGDRVLWIEIHCTVQLKTSNEIYCNLTFLQFVSTKYFFRLYYINYEYDDIILETVFDPYVDRYVCLIV